MFFDIQLFDRLLFLFICISILVIGLICCILRIFFCICPSHCISSTRRARNKKTAKIDADHTTSLLRGDNKRVLISRGPNSQVNFSIIYRLLIFFPIYLTFYLFMNIAKTNTNTKIVNKTR